jgi:hypothetical protein
VSATNAQTLGVLKLLKIQIERYSIVIIIDYKGVKKKRNNSVTFELKGVKNPISPP